jgi:hypothetical protein
MNKGIDLVRFEVEMKNERRDVGRQARAGEAVWRNEVVGETDFFWTEQLPGYRHHDRWRITWRLSNIPWAGSKRKTRP